MAARRDVQNQNEHRLNANATSGVNKRADAVQETEDGQDAHAKSGRSKMIAAVQVRWKKLRPDLSTKDELREERLAWITGVLGLKRPLQSLKRLTDRQLLRVLDEMDGLKAQPRLPAPGFEPRRLAPPVATEAEIIHLATAEQVATIMKLLSYLGWTEEFQKKFIVQRFKRSNPVHLQPTQAGSLIRILLGIAAARELKDAGFEKVSRSQIAMQIPALKKRLGIDRKPEAPVEKAPLLGGEECLRH